MNRAAELTHRCVDEIVASTVEAALTAQLALPAELAAELAARQIFGDEALWAASYPSMSAFEQQRLAQLNEAAQDHPLTPAEEAEQQSLLRRAQALALLKQRGHNVTSALQPVQES